MKSCIMVPLVSRQEPAGVISFMLGEGERRYGAADLSLAQQLAERASLAIDNARLFEMEKLARAQAESSERHYRFLAESMPQIVWTSKADGSIDYINQVWAAFVGTDGVDFGDRDLRRFIHPDDQARSRERWNRCLQSGEPYEVEYRLRRKDGVYRWFLVRGVAMWGSNGEIVKWFGTCTDVEAFKRGESELQKAIKLREDFLSIAGHELKTPLTALQLQVDVAAKLSATRPAETEADAKLVDRLRKACEQVRRVNRMVEDLLDVTRITSGLLKLQEEDFDLAEMVGETVGRYAETAAKQGCRIDFLASHHPVGRWDRARLEQVLTNLLSNAIKYGHGKPVEIEVARRDGWAVLSVRDQGIGIEPQHQQRIFERFERAASEHQFGGFGLGLWIARRIVEASGGKISLESSAGQGATFSVFLPMRAEESVSRPAAGDLDARA